MREPHLIPPFVYAGRWYLVENWEPGREHGPATIRPLDPRETQLLLRYLSDVLTEAWAVIVPDQRPK